MSLDMNRTIVSIHDGTKEVAEAAHVKTSEFHDKYVSLCKDHNMYLLS